MDPKNYSLVIVILTAPSNLARRSAIRETWLNLRPPNITYPNEIIFTPQIYENFTLEKQKIENQRNSLKKFQNWLPKSEKVREKMSNFKVKTFFAIGTAGLSQNEKRKIESENQVFHDLLLIEDLHDSYANLTLKITKAMKVRKVLEKFDC